MSSKIYRLTQYTEFGKTFKTKDRDIYVLFRNNKKDRGIYATDDEELQKAIESDKDYGVLFVLGCIVGEPTKPKEVAKIESSNEEKETKVEEVKEESAENELKVKNIQEANALAKKMFGKDTPTFRLTEKVVEFFKQKGYTLSF